MESEDRDERKSDASPAIRPRLAQGPANDSELVLPHTQVSNASSYQANMDPISLPPQHREVSTGLVLPDTSPAVSGAYTPPVSGPLVQPEFAPIIRAPSRSPSHSPRQKT